MQSGMIGLSFGVENKLVHGVFYYAGGAETPTVVLCHGFPGFEKNGDIAHALCRAGFNVMCFSYRGAWGSQGEFTFSNVIVDTCKAVRYVLSSEFPLLELIDKNAVVIIGHSMGGFAALMASARLPEVKNVISIAGWNIGRNACVSRSSSDVKARVDSILAGAFVLNGTSIAALWDEMYQYEDEFELCGIAQRIKDKKILLIAAENDKDTPPELNHLPLLKSFRESNVNVDERWFDSEHSFSGKRLELIETIIEWLNFTLR